MCTGISVKENRQKPEFNGDFKTGRVLEGSSLYCLLGERASIMQP